MICCCNPSYDGDLYHEQQRLSCDCNGIFKEVKNKWPNTQALMVFLLCGMPGML